VVGDRAQRKRPGGAAREQRNATNAVDAVRCRPSGGARFDQPVSLSQITSLPGAQSEVDPSSTFLQLEMASGSDTLLPLDVRQAIALSIDREALITQQVNWALANEQVSTSHIEVQGQLNYHGPPGSDTPPTVPTSTTTSTTTIGQGGSVNFPVTPVLDQASS